jgi:hypothetical protein
VECADSELSASNIVSILSSLGFSKWQVLVHCKLHRSSLAQLATSHQSQSVDRFTLAWSCSTCSATYDGLLVSSTDIPYSTSGTAQSLICRTSSAMPSSHPRSSHSRSRKPLEEAFPSSRDHACLQQCPRLVQATSTPPFAAHIDHASLLSLGAQDSSFYIAIFTQMPYSLNSVSLPHSLPTRP